jgi:hypothetical protein
MPADPTVSVWEDDPLPAVLVSRPAPDLTAAWLAYTFPDPQPEAAEYQSGTPEFRFWVAVEALRRGADFWGRRVPGGQWQLGTALPVILDAGEDLNAYYNRASVSFFHATVNGDTVYSGESADVLCHEMGHAILDAVKPELWNAASHEVAAFHESFGDMSAILSALQLPSLRSAILADTGGSLDQSSRLSRLAEQLGAAIRVGRPDLVDTDCLRNAVNSFSYQDPVNLPQRAPATQLSSEAHSFSRVFTGAFFDAISGMLAARAADANAPTEAELAQVASDMADILILGIQNAPVVPNFYAQVAAGMLQAADATNTVYTPVLRAAFVQRAILSLDSAANVADLQTSTETIPMTESLSSLAMSADQYGLTKPLLVHAASHARAYIATSAATQGNGAHEPASSSTAARAYVDDLFTRGRVHYGDVASPHLNHGKRLRSHKLVAEGGGIRLHRCLFDCGLTR